MDWQIDVCWAYYSMEAEEDISKDEHSSDSWSPSVPRTMEEPLSSRELG